MRDDELLVAEGNEDIDRICLSSGTHVEEQVKLRSKALTQGNAAIAETVLHYLEAFAYHHQKGDPFRGVLRTNTKITVRKRTTIGNWILGNNVDIPNFGVELRKLVTKHKPSLNGALKLVLSDVAVTSRFIDSVEWASASPHVDPVLSQLLATRAPGVEVSLARAALLEQLLKRASLFDVAHRSLRRIDADIAFDGLRPQHAAGNGDRTREGLAACHMVKGRTTQCRDCTSL